MKKVTTTKIQFIESLSIEEARILRTLSHFGHKRLRDLKKGKLKLRTTDHTFQSKYLKIPFSY